MPPQHSMGCEWPLLVLNSNTWMWPLLGHVKGTRSSGPLDTGDSTAAGGMVCAVRPSQSMPPAREECCWHSASSLHMFRAFLLPIHLVAAQQLVCMKEIEHREGLQAAEVTPNHTRNRLGHTFVASMEPPVSSNTVGLLRC